MKLLKLIQNNVTNSLVLIVTLFSLFISFQITSNNYKDNSHYSEAYFFMNKHELSISSNDIQRTDTDDNDMYYLVDSPKDTGCLDKGHLKYYLLDKEWYGITERTNLELRYVG